MAEVSVVPSESLLKNRSVWGMTVAQFLGAFNDNLFKQVVLLAALDVPRGANAQWLATLLFSLPFVLFSGVAGFLSDRFSKRRIVLLCKMAEVGIMAVGALTVAKGWLPGSLAIVFLMGTHSAFFGPSKYGILPELVSARQLPSINGVFLMTTFLAIILGTGAGGFLKAEISGNAVVAALAFMGVAVLGTLAASLVRRTKAAQPELPFRWEDGLVSGETIGVIRDDRALLTVMLVSTLFWFCGGVVQQIVNEFGKRHLYQDLPLAAQDAATSLLVACLAIGIAVGCPLAGLASRGRIDFRLTIAGAWGIVGCLLCLWLLGTTPPDSGWTIWPARLLLVGLGISTGFYTLPLQVFIQSRPSEDRKGRVLGAMNLMQWIGICLAAAFYKGCNTVNAAFDWPISSSFAATAVVMLPVALCFRPGPSFTAKSGETIGDSTECVGTAESSQPGGTP